MPNEPFTIADVSPEGGLPDEISWRSKVFDTIGRLLIGPPEKLGVRSSFYYIQADRPQLLSIESLHGNVRDQFIRRDLRVLIARRMLVVGAVVVAISVLFTGGYTQALAVSGPALVARFFN